MRILILLFVIVTGCGPKKVIDSSTYKDKNGVENKSSRIEFTSYDSKIQSDTSQNHQYGEINLIKDHNGIYHSLNMEGYIYSERFPGVLNIKNLRRSKIENIKFYENQKLIKSIALEFLNPYRKRHANIRFGYPNFEEFKMPGGDFQQEKPDEFLTFYDFGQTSLNGYSVVTYFLSPISQKTKLPWETISLIFDKHGEIVHEHKENSDIIPALLSDDGKLFGYSYAANSDNPGNIKRETSFRVFDLQKNKLIIELNGGGSASDTEPGLISRISGYSETQKRRVEFLSLNQRKIYFKEFTKSEFNEAWKLHKSWLGLLSNYSFSEESF